MDRYEATPKIGAFAVHVEANDFLALVRDESVLAEMQAPLDEYMVPPHLASTGNEPRDRGRLAVYLGMPVRGSSFAAAHAAHATGGIAALQRISICHCGESWRGGLQTGHCAWSLSASGSWWPSHLHCEFRHADEDDGSRLPIGESRIA